MVWGFSMGTGLGNFIETGLRCLHVYWTSLFPWQLVWGVLMGTSIGCLHWNWSGMSAWELL